jgi:TonB family protein
MRRRAIHLILAIGFCVSGSAMVHGQPGRREPSPNTAGPNTKIRKPRQPPKAPKAKAPETANVVINASPSDTVLLINGQQVEGPGLTGLKPGAYVLTARRVGYNEESRSITLIAGENVPITITLDPVRGRLSVTPNVSGAEIMVKKVGSDDSQSPTTFTNNVADLNLPPGEYEISISREGYRAVKRTITLQPAGSVYLEPQLILWPTENKPAKPASMTIQTSHAGEYILVGLYGSSQNASPSGTLDVVVSETAQNSSRVSGLLPGFPCTVNLTTIDNVSDYSFTERPEAGNNWKRVIVKVRPKKNNRPLHFAISWVSLPLNGGPTGRVQEAAAPQMSSRFEPATVRRRVLPSYPTAARTGRPGGVVVVIVEINERGKVVSAKATEGPTALRHAAETAAKQWEFAPAKRDGVAVRASQRLVFNFQP